METRFYVQKIAFERLSTGGYEDLSNSTVGPNLWIQSAAAAKEDPGGIWYRLRSPSAEYRRFHEPFLWLADFAKHFLDYLHENDNVSINMFASNFYDWLKDQYGNDAIFVNWLGTYADTDFRRVVTAHPLFLRHEARQLSEDYLSHSVWSEIGPEGTELKAMPFQPIQEKRTVVTSFVYHCFKHMSFAKFLKPIPGSNRLEGFRRIEPVFSDTMSETKPPTPGNNKSEYESRHPLVIRIGDVIKLNRDDVETSKWKGPEESWYAYVQEIKIKRGRGNLCVIWLDSPSHTVCSEMYYPYHNELFLSDHCNCHDGLIPVDEVVSKTPVSFFSSPDGAGNGFFVRQRFSCDTGAFERLKQEHFTCKCRSQILPVRAEVGDTVLVARPSNSEESALEPVEVLSLNSHWATVRRLLRKRRDLGDVKAEPNELVYTPRFEVVPLDDIQRPCLVRFYTEEEHHYRKIPAPYSRWRTADSFYIIYEEIDPQGLRPLARPYPASLKQGFDPQETIAKPKLKEMDIFCGGGNFARGIEEGGAVEIQWAVDNNKYAMHIHRANLPDPDKVHLYLGSVNDYLTKV